MASALTVRLDTNAFYHLFNKTGGVVPAKAEKFKAAAASTTISVYDNPVSFCEIACHWGEGDGIAGVLRLADELCGHRMLPVPEFFIRNEIALGLGKPAPTNDESHLYVETRSRILKGDFGTADQAKKLCKDADANAIYFETAAKTLITGFPTLLLSAFPALTGKFGSTINEKKWDAYVQPLLPQTQMAKLLLPGILKWLHCDAMGLDETNYHKVPAVARLYRYYFGLIRYYVVRKRIPEQNDFEDLVLVCYSTATDFCLMRDDKYKRVLDTIFKGEAWYDDGWMDINSFVDKFL